MRDIDYRDWVIVIDDQPQHLELEVLIAHEIAHAYLGHGAGDPMPPDERERQVQELLREWGFIKEPTS